MSSSTSSSDPVRLISSRNYVAILCCVAVLFAGVYLLGQSIQLTDTITPENYLAKLQQIDTFGCKNSVRIDPEILVMGDSHSHTGIDFNLLSQGFGTQKIGTCSLGSMYVESILFALRRYEAMGKLPKKIIYGMSARSFWNEQIKKKMLFSHKSQFNALGSWDLLFSIKNIFEYFHPTDGEEYKTVQRVLREYTPLVEAMDEQRVWEALRRSAPTARRMIAWQRKIDHAEFVDGAEDIVREIGELVRRNNVELYVVAIPESPWLETRYPEWIRKRYVELLEGFKPYARGVYMYTAEDAGLGNRYYINRFFKPGYDYAKWNEPGYVEPEDFDPDHLNSVGAVRFTRFMMADVFGIRI